MTYEKSMTNEFKKVAKFVGPPLKAMAWGTLICFLPPAVVIAYHIISGPRP